MKKLKWKFTCRKRAYSLIELVLSIAVLLIISMVLTSILGVSQKALNKTYINQSTNSEMSYAIEYIKDEIDNADYYTIINGKIYFIKKFDGNYIYINYGIEANQLFRFSTVAKSLKKFHQLSTRGKNALTGEIEDFKLSDEGDYFNIYLKISNRDKINFKVAKRIASYE